MCYSYFHKNEGMSTFIKNLKDYWIEQLTVNNNCKKKKYSSFTKIDYISYLLTLVEIKKTLK